MIAVCACKYLTKNCTFVQGKKFYVIHFSPNFISYIFHQILCHTLFTKFYQGDQMQTNEMGGTCSMFGERRVAHRVLVGRTEGKKTLG